MCHRWTPPSCVKEGEAKQGGPFSCPKECVAKLEGEPSCTKKSVAYREDSLCQKMGVSKLGGAPLLGPGGGRNKMSGSTPLCQRVVVAKSGGLPTVSTSECSEIPGTSLCQKWKPLSCVRAGCCEIGGGRPPSSA